MRVAVAVQNILSGARRRWQALISGDNIRGLLGTLPGHAAAA